MLCVETPAHVITTHAVFRARNLPSLSQPSTPSRPPASHGHQHACMPHMCFSAQHPCGFLRFRQTTRTTRHAGAVPQGERVHGCARHMHRGAPIRSRILRDPGRMHGHSGADVPAVIRRRCGGWGSVHDDAGCARDAGAARAAVSDGVRSANAGRGLCCAPRI